MDFLAHRAIQGAAGVLALAIAAAMPSARAQDRSIRLADYHHAIWGARQGAPADIDAMAQTRDGWLWLGTPRGLFRFDGVGFDKFAPQAGPQLLSDGISSLWAGDDGDLWIGYADGGMSVLHEGILRHVASPGRDAPLGATYRMAMDRDGSMWAANARGLRHYTGGAWHGVGLADGFPGATADAVWSDRGGRLWASNGQRIYLLDPATGKFTDTGIDGSADDLAESADGRLWLGEQTAWRALPVPAGARAPLPPRPWQHTGRRVGLFDRAGNLWQLRCPVGVCRTAGAPSRAVARFAVASAAQDRLELPWQMSDRGALTMLEDREGNIWIGMPGGLERLRRQKLQAAKLPPGAAYFQVANDAQGRLWAVTVTTALLFKVAIDGPVQVDRTRAHLAIGTATDGSLLLADGERLERRHAGRSAFVALPAGPDGKPSRNNSPQVVCGDADTAWVGISFRGLFHFDHGRWVDTRKYGIVPAGLRAAVPRRPRRAGRRVRIESLDHYRRRRRHWRACRHPGAGRAGRALRVDRHARARGAAWWNFYTAAASRCRDHVHADDTRRAGL